MSGGSFDYAYLGMLNFADQLGARIDEEEKIDKFGCQPNKFSQEVINKLREIERITRYAGRLAQEAEYLYSGDTGEESFISNLNDIENENE